MIGSTAAKIATLAFALLAGLAAQSAQAETQVFGPGTYNAWIDTRLVATGGETAWLDGGFGKLRYGRGDNGVKLAQAGVAWTPRLTDSLTAHVIAQYVPDAVNPLGVEEAFVKWKPVPTSDLRYSVRLGQFFPPISMEHDGVGWTTTRTLTPSAINSWVGEEVLVQGLEGTLQKTFGEHMLGLTVGGFSRDDTAGTVLAWRGWALHDIASADNTELPLPSGNSQGWYRIFHGAQAANSKPVVEVDHRVGWYGRLDWRPPAAVAFNVEIYDNQGDPVAFRNGQWGWATRFYNAGFRAQLDPATEILGQAMWGRTLMGWRRLDGARVVDADFDSAFLLVSRSLADGSRLSGRIETFGVKDNSMRAIDDNTDKGHALTAAWMKPLGAHLDLTIEGVSVSSKHPTRVTHELNPRQSQTSLQFALKAHF